MKTILQKALLLDKYAFIEHIISLNQKKVISTLDSDDNLKEQYRQKVSQLYTDGMNINYWHKDMKFAESSALVQLLTPEQRGRVFFASIVQRNNFTASYHAVEHEFILQEDLVEHLSQLVLDEIGRLAIDDAVAHLEKNINYLDYLEKAFKPFIEDSLYVFVLYASFIHHVKKGSIFNNHNFLNMIDMLSEEQLEMFKPEYYQVSLKLIDSYKKKLHFDDWPSNLKNLFYKDIKTPNPYNCGGISSWQFTIEEFKPYGSIIEKFILNDIFNDKFPALGKTSKKTKL